MPRAACWALGAGRVLAAWALGGCWLLGVAERCALPFSQSHRLGAPPGGVECFRLAG
ncbi:hypothetical protein [Microbacterium elymi]|uniref:Uncharacterized protein n=1 Tax=Microbacterium elymi TaxID=2909587 RepID=A0ABY5NIF5_9MICO|nr:hypothetical protein [Microbacterium elymi]UUT34945.1 hypothetical protein L2X98_31675 [Microbacterium elymi]